MRSLRRPAARLLAPGLAGLLLAGCGFHLRGELPEKSAARNLYITGIGPGNPFYGDLTRMLGDYGGQVAPKPDQAGAIVRVISAGHYRRPITLSSGGRANSFDLSFRVVYGIDSPKGEELVPEQELIIRRDYFNQQLSPLGQGSEEAQLRQEMEYEAAQAMLRRVIFRLNNPPPPKPVAKAPDAGAPAAAPGTLAPNRGPDAGAPQVQDPDPFGSP
jgi:LPS-assembly lipoprotein